MSIPRLPFAIGFCAAGLGAALLSSASASPAAAVTPSGAAAFNALRPADGDHAGRRPLMQSTTAAHNAAPQGGTPANWQALGPFGGDITDVAASPTAAGLVLAGIAPGGGGGGTLYRSTDNAANWLPVAALAFRSIYDIEFNAAGDVFIATDNGVMSSTDDGATWVHHDLGIGASQQVLDVALDPNDAAVVWAGVADAFGSQPANLVRSGDGGQSWVDRTPPHAAAMSGTAIVVDPTDSDTVIAAFGGAISGGEVWVSVDGGATWADRSSGLPNNLMRALAYDGTRLLVGGGQAFGSQYVGLYSSTDLGQSWTRRDDATWPLAVVSAIAVDPADAQTILAAIDGIGVNRSTDGGATWQVQIGGSGTIAAQSLRYGPGSSSALWLGASSLGVFRSSDSGESFVAASTGIAELGLYAVDTSPVDAGQLAVAFQSNNNGGVLTSADGGATWQREPAPPTRYSTVRFAPDGTLYALSNGPTTVAPEGLWRRNGSGGWTPLGPDMGGLFESDLVAIRFSESDPNVIFLGGVDFGVAGDEAAIWRSDDAGATWARVHEGDPGGNKIVDIEFIPGMAEQSIIAAFDGSQGATQGGALASGDGGQFWVQTTIGLPTFARFPRLCSSAANPNTVLMSMWDSWGSGAIYVSRNNGATWDSTGWQGGTVTDIACEPQDAQVVYVAQSGADQVVRSTDQGQTFVPFATGLALAGTPSELALSRTGTPRLYLSGPHGSYVTAREGGVVDVVFADGFD